MDKIEIIDSIIQTLTDEQHQNLFDRWRKEYKQRYYVSHQKDPQPKAHSGYPGFEKNLNALLFNKLQDKDPHSEWAYASCINESSEKVDIHIIDDGCEIWFELGMYATDEKAKYNKDFHKLLAVIENTVQNNIGVLIHFEIFEKNKVFTIFQELKSQYEDQYVIDIREFKNDLRVIACRLIIKSKRADRDRDAHH